MNFDVYAETEMRSTSWEGGMRMECVHSVGKHCRSGRVWKAPVKLVIPQRRKLGASHLHCGICADAPRVASDGTMGMAPRPNSEAILK